MGILEQLQQAVGSGRSGQNIYRLPGDMLCHEGLLKLRQMDEKEPHRIRSHPENLSGAALKRHPGCKHMFIHRSTFLYRIERIREILQSELTDPEELFYLELSLRLLEQEDEKG